MNELFSSTIAREEAEQPELLIATAGSVTSAGITLILPGTSAATQKRYKRLLTGESIAAGDRVLAAKISGSYVVLGKIAYA